jgi:hypothetical protein
VTGTKPLQVQFDLFLIAYVLTELDIGWDSCLFDEKNKARHKGLITLADGEYASPPNGKSTVAAHSSQASAKKAM